MDEQRYLLMHAEDDIDEDEGLTKLEILVMLANELGYDLAKRTTRILSGPGKGLHKA